MTTKYLLPYSEQITALLSEFEEKKLREAAEIISNTVSLSSKIILAGNGGSAAMASHITVDFLKAASIRCLNFNESDLITCYANDYGYANWVKKALESYLDSGDTVILISSSGKSENIVNAANYCVERKVKLITLTGFNRGNPLSLLGDVNIWVNSNVYNYVEMAHHIWLAALVDYFANNKEVLQSKKT